MNVSKAIRSIREEKGITQADLAKALGIERTNYHRLENRDNKLSLEQIEQIAKALGVSLIELLTWGESEQVKSQTQESTDLLKENEELKKRVSELEDRVKDKNSLLLKYEFETSAAIESFEFYLSNKIEGLAFQKGIGKFRIIDSKGTFDFPMSMFKDGMVGEHYQGDWLDSFFTFELEEWDTMLLELLKKDPPLLEMLHGFHSAGLLNETMVDFLKRYRRNPLIESARFNLDEEQS